jgi:hypothetical protein
MPRPRWRSLYAAALAAVIAAVTSSGCGSMLRIGSPPYRCERQRDDLVDAWAAYVQVSAALIAITRYPQEDAPTQAKYIAAAQAYYLREYELRLAGAPWKPANAARLSIQASWHPGR